MNADTRLGRQGFWIGSLLVWAAFFGLRPVMTAWPTLHLAWAATALLALMVLMRARLLDRGLSPWWMLAVMVPVLGAVWLFWELACRKAHDAGLPRR
ncbi:MAG TPA: DUF805 domain-containing protein [Ideonella sp.]|uniref:DUF805 domain-containing protein n=1 Tax=Ideonella sp. TaxID=1929293 RepID=UPI002E347A81|nr:DUF805 domain-containing protein [Ideonella sp.]HEX5685599.1 DUF805 domain-containing protein [Ideonella sp.]